MGGFLQNMQILDAANTAQQAKSQSDSLRAEVDDLLRRHQRLELACAAMWELLRDQCQLQDEVLAAKMAQLETSRAANVTAKLIVCPDCNHKNAVLRRKCLYCGNELPMQNPFA